MYDVSQLPVVEDSKIVGIVDESDLLLAASNRSGAAFRSRCERFMTTNLETVPPRRHAGTSCNRFSKPAAWRSWPTRRVFTA